VASCDGKYLGTYYTIADASEAYQAELRKINYV
jgi:hypothetical protein